MLIDVVPHTRVEVVGAWYRPAPLKCVLPLLTSTYMCLTSEMGSEVSITLYRKVPKEVVVSFPSDIPYMCSYMCKYLSTPHSRDDVRARQPVPTLQGTKSLWPLRWDRLVIQLWGQAPRFTSPSWSTHDAPKSTLPLPSPVRTFQGATISLGS